jgi:o-succinylbenzoate synthase
LNVPLKVSYFPYTLNFTFQAGTSRGILTEKTSWLLVLEDEHSQGWGEAGPLPGLSPESGADLGAVFNVLRRKLTNETLPASEEECLMLAERLVSIQYPSVRFALETALLDLFHGGRQLIIPSDFYASGNKIPINGLIWMGDPAFMREQFEIKKNQGFSCFKMKVGALSFGQELETLAYIRKLTNDVLRVDANGAFRAHDVYEKLDALSRFGLHSIEQPVSAGQWDLMSDICRSNMIDVALDEELIGINTDDERRRMMDKIRPQYLIFKPSLIGGIAATRRWAEVAEEFEAGWWMTSALESNIGLNAICQLTDSLNYNGHQGLGTGQLYANNIMSPLHVSKGEIGYNVSEKWHFPKKQSS